MRWFLFAMPLLLIPSTLGAESAAGLARLGNQRFEQERYQEAIEAYRRALELDPSSEVIQYNLGTALARRAEHEEAGQVLEQVAEQPGAALRRDALFNLGVNAIDAAAAATRGGAGAMPNAAVQAIQGQIERLENAQAAFRKAILTDLTDDEARYNYEVTREALMTLRKLLEQAQQQQQQQGQQQGQQGDRDQQGQNPQQQQDSQRGEQDRRDSRQPEGDPQQQQDDSREEQSEGQSSGLEATPTPTPAPSPGEQRREPEDRRAQTTPQSAQGGEVSPGQADREEPLTPEQMDALRLLNLLESEDPEQFKRLFRFRGKSQGRTPEKDW